jgi:hypothetical protein
LYPLQVRSQLGIREDAVGVQHFAPRPKLIRHSVDVLRRVDCYPQPGRDFLKPFDQRAAKRHCNEHIDRGRRFVHFVDTVRTAAAIPRPSSSQLERENPDCADGYNRIEDSMMVRNAIE